MSKGVNKVILIGHLGNDPEFKQSEGGVARALLSIATSHSVKDGDGWRDETDWHRVVFFARMAEVARDYLKKGSQVYIEGRLQTRDYTDKEGVKKYITEVIGQELQMLGSKNQGENSGSGNYENRPPVNQPPQPPPPQPSPPPQYASRQPPAPPPVAPAPQPAKAYDDDIPF